MPYDLNKLTKLNAIKQLAERVNRDFATKTSVSTLSSKVDTLVSTGGEPNVIETVKVNGSALTVTDKAVDVTVPTKVSDLTNDSKFQTESEVNTAISKAVTDIDHLSRKKVASVDAIDTSASDADRYIYMVPKAGDKTGDKYDEYMIIDGSLEKVGDWAVDLSGYVQKEDGKGLSTNDFTNADKTKLAGIAEGATKTVVVASTNAGYIKVNDVDIKVVDIATDDEVIGMLDEMFGSES